MKPKPSHGQKSLLPEVPTFRRCRVCNRPLTKGTENVGPKCKQKETKGNP